MLILRVSQDVSEILRSSHSTGTVVEELKINLREKSDIIIKGLNESSLVHKELLTEMQELRQLRDQILDLVKTGPAEGNLDNDYPKPDDFLESLRFRHMDDREDAIPDAHARTYRWLLSDSNPKPELGEESNYEAVRSKVRTHITETFSQLGINVNKQGDPIGLNAHDRGPSGNLHDWLKSEDRIFWIWGKPGCGKSTLMKLMLRDWKMKKRLQKMLMEWSDSKPLLIASFFFFRPGMNMQKSQSGFLRSLLYQIFSQRRDAINNVFTATEQNKAIARASEANYDEDVWSDREMLRAFRKWRESDDVKLYLHVDGIDEIDATYAMITQMITDMAEHENVKILVAGRWSPEFQATFPHTLALHETTSLDILQFTVDNLRQPQVIEILDLPGEQFLSIVKELVEAAQGVFQWVKIVVQSLLHGVHRFERFSQLKARLLEYPRELDQLYWFLYNSIEANHMSDAAYWLLTVCLSVNWPDMRLASSLNHRQNDLRSATSTMSFSSGINARQMALIDKFDVDNPICLENMLRYTNSPGNTLDAQAKVIQRRMRSQCPHFFDIGPAQEGCKISLAHRTVLDFLTISEIQDRLQKNLLSGKDPLFGLIAVNVAMQHFQTVSNPDIIYFWNCLPFMRKTVHLTQRKPFSSVRKFWPHIAFMFQKYHTVVSQWTTVLYPTLWGWRNEASTKFLRHIFTDSTDPMAYILAYWHPDSSHVGAYISRSSLGPREKELLLVLRCTKLHCEDQCINKPSLKPVSEQFFKLLLPNGTPKLSIGFTLLCDALDYYLRMVYRDIDIVKADLQTVLPLLHLFIDNGADPGVTPPTHLYRHVRILSFTTICNAFIGLITQREPSRLPEHDGQNAVAETMEREEWQMLTKSLEDLIAKSDNYRVGQT